MSVEKNYFYVFPVTLFECYDEKTRMHFIFSLKKEYKNMEEIIKILKHCGAKVGYHKKDTTIHSAVITDHNEVIDFCGPAFTIDYITDCLQSGKQQDIGKYRQEATRHLVEDSICMQVVYYKKFGWDSVISEENKNWIANNFKVELLEDESMNDGKSPRPCLENSNDKEVNMDNIADSRCKINVVHKDSNEKDTDAVLNVATVEEEKSSDLGSQGNQVKEQELLTSTNAQNLLCKKRNRFPCNLLDVDSESEVEETVVTSTKRSRRPYTKEEQYNILKYIVTHEEYSRMKGRELWTIMETLKVCPSRTWQSMKENFIKKIVYNLDNYDILSKEQKRKIKRAFF